MSQEINKYALSQLRKWGSLLRPDLYGEFKEVDWRGKYVCHEAYLEAVRTWERAHGVEELQA